MTSPVERQDATAELQRMGEQIDLPISAIAEDDQGMEAESGELEVQAEEEEEPEVDG